MALHHKIGNIAKGICATGFSAALLVVFQTNSGEAIANATGYYELLRNWGAFDWLRVHQLPIVLVLGLATVGSLALTIRSAVRLRKAPARPDAESGRVTASERGGVSITGSVGTIQFWVFRRSSG